MTSRPATLGAAVGALSVLLLCVAAPALAAGEGLPRGYQVVRIDSPQPALGAVFGRGMASAGDVDRDGEDDLLLPQQAGSPGGEGQVFVISGETGARIDTIVAPDPGNPTNATGNNRAGFGSFWASRIGSNRGGPGSFTDLASCPGGTSGALCPTAIGPPDGVPEIVIGARGVDARGLRDSGRVYVYDGATRALLKRIDQPAADTTPLALSTAGGTNFGRNALNPSGLTACEGNFGLGACPTMPRAVEIGDMDGQGRPDLVIGAPHTTEDSTTAHPASHCARTPGARCELAGRVYVYRGEEIVGSNPQEILDGTTNGQNAGGTVIAESFTRIKNPGAQADDQQSVNVDNEQLGNSLSAIGDVGKCNAPIPAGEECPRASSVTTPDGLPEVVVPAPGVDLPIDDPDPAYGNAGVVFLVDGATRSVLSTYAHPERQLGSTFGSQLGSHEPAVGDLGSTGLPDIYAPAPGQNTVFTSAGRGYVLNGNFKGGSSTRLVARLDDPTPNVRGNFGGGSAGVGDLVGGAASPANELLIGTEGFTLSPNSDVHFFNAATEKVLQTVADPDAQSGSAFGGAIVPLQDLNEDRFLDFAVSAENFSGATGIGEGRIYIFRSDNSRAPTPRAPGGDGGAPRQQPPTPFAGCPALSANVVRGSAAGGRITGTVRGDRIFGGTGNDIVDGLAGDDCIDLGPGTDTGQGGLGNDLILGGLGEDRMSGSSGNDGLRGGSSPDRINGGFGNDRLHGQAGGDRIAGSRGRDRVNGGSSNDVISSGSSNDRAAGDQGNDRINGNSGNDALFGNSGNDRITGSTGADRISGGGGNDRINSRDGRRDRLDCGRGRDRLIADRFDRVARNCERVSRRR